MLNPTARPLFVVSVLFAVLLSGAVFSGCSAPSVSAAPLLGFTKLKGDFAASSGAVTASNDFEDLGIDERETEAGARVDLKWGAPHLTFSFARVDQSGDGTTTAQLENDGVTIPVGATVSSDIELTRGAAIVTFDVLPTDVVELGLGFGVELMQIDGTITATVGGNSIETDETVPLPVVAGRATVNVGIFDVSLLATGMNVSIDGDEVNFLDLDLQARMSVFEHGRLVVGYRDWSADLEYDDDGDQIEADLELEGPYIGFALTF